MSRPAPRRAPALRPALIEGVAAAVALAAGLLVAWPVRPTPSPLERRAPVVPAPPPRLPAADSTGALIVGTNLFSGTRRAPRERFRLPGSDGPADAPAGPTAAMAVPGEPAPPEPGASGDAAGPQLYGITIVDGMARALVLLPEERVPRLVRDGMRVGPWRIGRIFSDRLELVHPSGTRLLRLTRRQPTDSAGTPPA